MMSARIRRRGGAMIPAEPSRMRGRRDDPQRK
jgi:hypothetical protein